MKRLILALLTLAAISCGGGGSKPPQPPPVDPTIYAHDCTVLYHDELGRDPDPEGLYGCEKRLSARKPDGVTPVETQEDFRAWLNSTDEGKAYDAAQAEVHLPRIVRHVGKFFKLEDGSYFNIIDTSEFQALRILLEQGEGAADNLLARDANAGFNSIRVFGMFNNPRKCINNDPTRCTPEGGLGRFIPAEHATEYWPGLRKLCKMAAKRGLYVEFVVFADTSAISVDYPSHWANVQGLSDITNLYVEAINEADQPYNRVPNSMWLDSLPKPQGVFASHGSNGSDAWPVKPYWDYVTFHTSSSEWQRKVGHNGWEIDFNGPVKTNETARYPDRESQPYRAEDAAWGASIFVGGATFHSAGGKYGEAWNNVEAEAAAAWVRGAKKFWGRCQSTGPYRHDEFIPQEKSQGLLRIYLMGYDPSCTVSIRN